MKKYNLSYIMKRAWELVNKEAMTLSQALRKAWAEAKNKRGVVVMCVIGKETFTVNAQTGIVTGKTYNSRNFLKDNFKAVWDGTSRQWTVDVVKFNAELDKHSNYYKKYIVEEKSCKAIKSKELVNGNDGFYSHIAYTDGTSEYVFVG